MKHPDPSNFEPLDKLFNGASRQGSAVGCGADAADLTTGNSTLGIPFLFWRGNGGLDVRRSDHVVIGCLFFSSGWVSGSGAVSDDQTWFSSLSSVESVGSQNFDTFVLYNCITLLEQVSFKF